MKVIEAVIVATSELGQLTLLSCDFKQITHIDITLSGSKHFKTIELHHNNMTRKKGRILQVVLVG